MQLHDEQCQTLATALVTMHHPDPILPDPLPCTPLELLVALHNEVRRSMLTDPAYANRAAAIARCIAEQFPDNPIHFAQAHWSSGSAILYLPDYVGALAHYDQALAWYARAVKHFAPEPPPRDVRAVHVVRVFCLSELGRYREAQQAIAAAEAWLAEHPDAYAELTLMLNRSQLAGRMGLYAEMLVHADATIALARKLEYLDRAAQGWLNRANACVFLGRYAEAAEAIEQAQQFALEAGEDLTVARARLCRAWLLHTQGQLFAALTELRAAAEAFAQAPGETATVLLEEAVISAQLQQLPEALAAARRAADLFHSQGMTVYSVEAALYAARIAVRLGQSNTARQLLAQARAHIEVGSHALLESTLHLTNALIASLPAPQLSPASLRRVRQRAYAAASRAVDDLTAAGFDLAAAEGKQILCRLAVQLGRTDVAITGYQSLLDHPQPAIRVEAHAALGTLLPVNLAYPHLERAAELTVIQRRSLPMEELQARYSGETAAIHMRLAACALDLNMPERAAAVIWEAKAGSLLDLRATAATEPSVHSLIAASKAELARLNRLADEHRRMAFAANSSQEHEQANYHIGQAQVHMSEAQACAAALTAQIRTLADRNGQRAVPDLAAVQSTLPAGSALLEWFQIDEILYAMLVLPDQPPTFRPITDARTVAKLLDRWSLVVHRYQGASQTRGVRAIQQTLLPLSELLLGPWRSDLAPLERVVIAPVGLLYHAPWTALARQMADRLTVMLTPSGGLWAAPPEAPDRPVGPPRLLGAVGAGSEQLRHLEAEIDAIAARLPSATVKLQATTDDLRVRPAPRLLHIAAHGRTHASVPLCSTIELADGPFLLLEVHRLDLRGTELVVLSACETGVRPDHGDMALALAGAFLCAGAGSVVASLWRVDDAATADFMTQFYQALTDELTLASALRQAQSIVQDRYPLDYAAFQLWVGTAQVVSAPIVQLATESEAGAL